MRYQITSDSTCDLSPEQLEKYNIRLLSLYVDMDGRTLRDGVDVKPDDIYAHVAAGGGLPKTAAVNMADYVRAFTGRTACELRHLAVRADCRGHGLAQQLLTHMTARTGGQKCTVWARVGNTPAERFYEKNQFQPDGWSSAVLRLG